MTTAPAPVKPAAARLLGLLEQAAATSLTEQLPAPPPASRSPRRLRQFQILVTVALLVLGVVGSIQVLDLHSQLSSAPNLADQYARLASIETNLVEAGNTTAFRSLGAPATAITDRLESASQALVIAAAERPGDRETIATVNAAAQSYGALLQQANASAQPLTALAQADQVFSTKISPGLATLRSNLATEAKQRSWAFGGVPLWAVAILTFIALGWVSVAVAQRSRRVFNLGLVGGIVAAILITILGATATTTADWADHSSREAQFQQVVRLTAGGLGLADLRSDQARAAVAKTLPAATLTRLETSAAALDDVKPALGSVATTVAQRHRSITTSLTKSAWAEASAALLAKDTTEADSAFVTATATSTTAAVKAAATGPQSATGGLLAMAIAIGVLGALGAAAAFAGVGVRVKEYR